MRTERPLSGWVESGLDRPTALGMETSSNQSWPAAVPTGSWDEVQQLAAEVLGAAVAFTVLDGDRPHILRREANALEWLEVSGSVAPPRLVALLPSFLTPAAAAL